MIASWKGRKRRGKKNLIDLLSLFFCVCACGGAPVFFFYLLLLEAVNDDVIYFLQGTLIPTHYTNGYH